VILAQNSIQNYSEITPLETAVTCKNGRVRHVKISLASIGKQNIVTFEDLTERKQAEIKIQRLNQLYAVLSYYNQAIVHCTTEQELFSRICQIAVQFGGFKMAWIGRIDSDTHMITPIASAGADADQYLHDIKISSDADNEYGQGPTGIALRENHPVWCQDFQNSPLTAPWHKLGAAVDWRSSAALPLRKEGIVFGSFILYSTELNAFDQAARSLLVEISADINFALDNFKHEAERKQTEKSLIESEEKFRAMSASAQDAIIMIDNVGKISFWNRAAENIFAYPAHEVLGKNLHLLLAPAKFHDESAKGFANFQHTNEGAAIGQTLELMALRKNGDEFPVELSLSAVQISGLWQSIGIIRDISKRKQIEAQMVSQYEHVTGVNTQLLEANKRLAQVQSQLLQSEKMAAIGLLAAGVAHEINNPVGYVNSNLSTLEKYLTDIFMVLNKNDELCELRICRTRKWPS
jgi:PAS domain S-box-containing protein